MKKILTIVTIIVVIFGIIFCIMPNKVYAEDLVQEVQREQGSLLKLTENQAKSLEEYKQKYGSDSYGLTAYILHIVQIYSIPFCFLGIIIRIIYKVIIGSRHLENAEKGLGMIVAVVTLTIICQVLPLVFALVVKIGRE